MRTRRDGLKLVAEFKATINVLLLQIMYCAIVNKVLLQVCVGVRMYLGHALSVE